MGFFRYPGGKSKLHKDIIKKLQGNFKLQYREPFFGGGAIGLKLLPFVENIWINDKDIGIFCIWQSVINYPNDIKTRILNFKPTVSDFHEMKHELLNTLITPTNKNEIIDIGFKKLTIHQISYSGLGTKSGGPLGGESQESKYKIDCRWSPFYICKKIDKLHNQLKTKKIQCTCLDFSDLIEDVSFDSLLYLDPPYYMKGNELYQYGFLPDDHIRLANALKTTKHSWILSYDDCSEIRDLYHWARIESLSVNYSITALKNKKTGERQARNKHELLIGNI